MMQETKKNEKHRGEREMQAREEKNQNKTKAAISDTFTNSFIVEFIHCKFYNTTNCPVQTNFKPVFFLLLF